MKLLLVEDDPRFAEVLAGALVRRIPEIEIDIAGTHVEAAALLSAPEYDLIICDLRIPMDAGAPADEIAPGLDVYRRARVAAPGTPIIVFSAYGTLDIVRSIYEESPRDDPFALGREEHLATFATKDDLPELVARVQELAAGLQAVEDVEITLGGSAVALSSPEKRALKLFARSRGGVLVRVSDLTEGLSDATVVRVEVPDEHGAVVASAVGRIAPLQAAEAEVRRYRDHVAGQLASGAFAHLIDKVSAGAGATGAAFYWFTGTGPAETAYDTPLFGLLPDDEARSCGSIAKLGEKLEPWVAASHQQEFAVREIRRLLIADEDLAALGADLPFDREAVEDVRVYARVGPEHGDLHGFNILVRADDDPVLIDYASVCLAPIALDPITLELSLLFHPESPLRGSCPDPNILDGWFDDDGYLKQMPVSGFQLSMSRMDPTTGHE